MLILQLAGYPAITALYRRVINHAARPRQQYRGRMHAVHASCRTQAIVPGIHARIRCSSATFSTASARVGFLKRSRGFSPSPIPRRCMMMSIIVDVCARSNRHI